MNLKLIMEELDAALSPGLTAAGFDTFDHPPGKVSGPSAILSYPERIDYHAAYQRGMIRLTIPLVVVVPRNNDEQASDVLGECCATTGDKSIMMIVENAGYTTLDAVTVTSVDFDVVEIAGASYLAALFTLDVAVSGG